MTFSEIFAWMGVLGKLEYKFMTLANFHVKIEILFYSFRFLEENLSQSVTKAHVSIFSSLYVLLNDINIDASFFNLIFILYYSRFTMLC